MLEEEWTSSLFISRHNKMAAKATETPSQSIYTASAEVVTMSRSPHQLIDHKDASSSTTTSTALLSSYLSREWIADFGDFRHQCRLY